MADANIESASFPPEKVSIAGLPFDDEDYLWNAFVGYRVNQHVAIQLGYSDLGEFQQFQNLFVLGSNPAVLEIEELSLSAKFQYPLTNKVSANWWLGISQSNFDVSGHVRLSQLPIIPGPPTTTIIPFSSPENEIGYLWGFGFNWRFTPRFSIDLNYLNHNVRVIDVETISLGLVVDL